MKKLLPKLIASILALAVSASLVAMSSYAWYAMSVSPEVGGIQINIGGTDTILVAPDIAVTGEDGSVYHYPGSFDLNLDLDHQSYAYLKTVAGLVPVSTADGLNWVVPDYYDPDDGKVQAGLAVDGQIKDPVDFQVDNRLNYANLTSGNESGSYIYLDFWLVAPLDGYQVRVSTGDDTEQSGSFVIALPTPETMEDGTHVLTDSNETASASVRVGFLASQDWASVQSVNLYKFSEGYHEGCEYLQGCYQEPGEPLEWYSASENRFTIYEPNGTLHPESGTKHYQITMPLGIVNGLISPVDVFEKLTVQTTTRWKEVVNSGTGETEKLLDQVLQAAMRDGRAQNLEPDQLFDYFYRDRLQMLLHPYLERGRFVQSTQALYGAASLSEGIVAEESIIWNSQLRGATEDVYITTLRKNIPQRIRMFIWLEGQDADCVNSDGSRFAVNIELAGASPNQ